MCLSLHGLNQARANKAAISQAQAQTSPSSLQQEQQNWTALETLAEVSRHFNLNDKPQEPNSHHALHGVANTNLAGEHVHGPQPSAVSDPVAVAGDSLIAALTSHPPSGSIPAFHSDRLELQHQFTVDNNAISSEDHEQRDKPGMLDSVSQNLLAALGYTQERAGDNQPPYQVQGQPVSRALEQSSEPLHTQHHPNGSYGPLAANEQPPEADSSKDLTAEEQLALLRACENMSSATPENIGMATAAAARVTMHQSLLDPQLLASEEHAQNTPSADDTAKPGTPGPAQTSQSSQNPEQGPATPVSTPVPVEVASSASVVPVKSHAESASQPPSMASMTSSWMQTPFVGDQFAQNQMLPIADMAHAQSPVLPNRGGMRLETGTLNGNRVRHARSRFDAARRKEVQEVRKIGACIRCRILRKTCSKGSPCDTCRKVLSPRIWRTGCIRTKLAEQLDLYSASVQVLLSHSNITNLKNNRKLMPAGSTTIVAAHFPDSGVDITVKVLEDVDKHESPSQTEAGAEQVDTPVVMVNYEKADLQLKMESYVRDLLPTLINSEPSHFARVTLETAQQILSQNPDDCLKGAIELWGYVEVLDRERSWHIREKRSEEDQGRWIPPQHEIYNTICLQFASAAERKANATSKALLNAMQRTLQDSKVKIGFSMYLACLILLHCVEKSSWSFKAWEQDNLRQLWPLDRAPNEFTTQGIGLSNILHVLLGIRRALPKIVCRDGILVAEDPDPAIQDYFSNLQLNGRFFDGDHALLSFLPCANLSLSLSYL